MVHLLQQCIQVTSCSFVQKLGSSPLNWKSVASTMVSDSSPAAAATDNSATQGPSIGSVLLLLQLDLGAQLRILASDCHGMML